MVTHNMTYLVGPCLASKRGNARASTPGTVCVTVRSRADTARTDERGRAAAVWANERGRVAAALVEVRAREAAAVPACATRPGMLWEWIVWVRSWIVWAKL